MTISLRALKTFMGRPGEARNPDGIVQMGDDFNVADKRRADDLEIRGLAAPLIKPRDKTESAPQNKMEPPLQNKAAQSGPLASAGGPTGETSPAFSLSPPDRVQPKRGSKKRADEHE